MHGLSMILGPQSVLLLIQTESRRTAVGNEEDCWLDLALEHSLSGNVESATTLPSRAPSVQRDAILLTFRDAKLTVLDWNELTGTIRSSSLHSWEADVSLRAGRNVFSCGPRALTDPQGRCAAVLLFQHHVALLPSTGADSLEAIVDAGGLSQASTLGLSYTANLSKLGVKEVRDAAFLHRYNEPVLLVLHESQPTWAGLYTERKDTMCLTAFSLNLMHQKHLRLWQATGLPSDAHRLVPVPLGGALVLCQTMVLYYSQGVSCALIVSPLASAGMQPPFMDLNPMREAPSATAARHANRFAMNVEPEAAGTVSRSAQKEDGVDLDLLDAASVWLTPSMLLLALAAGQLVMLSLEVVAGAVRKLRVQKANDVPRPSCACRLGQSWVFLGSWVGDSLLLHASSDGHKRNQAQIEGPAPVLALPAPESASVASKPPGVNGTANANYTANANEQADENQGVKADDQKGGQFNVKVGGAGSQDEDFEADQEAANGSGEDEDAKRRRLNPGENKSSEKQESDDEFESLFRSIETARISTIATGFTHFSFKVVDSLLGSGSIRCAVLGDVASAAPSEWGPSAPTQPPAHQLVACTGSGISGALSVMRRSIALAVITEVPLAGVRGLWAVRFRPEGLPWEPDFAFHAFLLLTVGRGTKVLQTGEELSELRAAQVDFVLDKPTILAANLLSWARTVQVCSDKVVLLAGSSKQAETSVQELIAPPEAPTGVQSEKAAVAALPGNVAGMKILAASAADPFVLLHLSNGSAALLQGSLDTGKLEVVQAARPALHEVPASDPSATITSCALYKDHSGWLASCSGIVATVFCVIANASGLLQIFALPSMELVFDHCPVTEGTQSLSGDPEAESDIPKDPAEESGQGDGDTEFFSARPVVIEVKMESFAQNSEAVDDDAEDSRPEKGARMPCERPVLLLLLSDGGMLAYQAFSSPVGLRFARLEVDWTGHADGRGAHGISSRMVRFDGLGEGKLTYSGVFVAGDWPLWLVASRGRLVPHPMEAGSVVAAMTPFNNVNCPQGCITASMQGAQGVLKIAQLPPQVRLDTPWPMQKIPLRVTPQVLAYMPEYNIYALVVSRLAPYQKRLPEEEGGDTQATYAYASCEAAAKAKGKEELGQLRLVRPDVWTTAFRFDLAPAETALCIRSLALHNGTSGQPQTLLAVGTAQVFGEDYPCTGRLLFFDVSKSEPAEGMQLDTWNAQLLYMREFQGPVTALASIEGSLLVAWGARLETHRWTGGRLETTAFHDANILVTSLSVIKRFIAYGDIHKGVHFLQLAADNRSFNSLSKDFDKCDVVATEFIINGPKLFVLSADLAKNLRLLTYRPDHPDSWAGKRMLPVGAFHTGHAISAVLATKIQPHGVKSPPRGALVAALDGSLASLTPLWLEGMAPPLRSLQRLLALKARATAGLNPRTFRDRAWKLPKAMHGGEHWGPPTNSQTMIDGDLLWQFQFLPHTKQVAVAYSVGFDKDQLLALLDSLAAATAVF